MKERKESTNCSLFSHLFEIGIFMQSMEISWEKHALALWPLKKPF